MQFRSFGKTGLQASELGFGALFTSTLGPGFEESRKAVHRAVDLGINFFDTAPAYANSEEVLGKILAEINEPLLVSTKLGGRPCPFDPQNKKHLRQSVEQSLRLLHRDTIDLLFIHEPDRYGQYPWWTDPIRTDGPVLEVLDELKQKGDIQFTGLGGTTTTELAHHIRSGKFDVVLTAFNYSALFREAAEEVLPDAERNKMGIVLGSVLHQGALARRYDNVVKARPMWLSQERQKQLLDLYALLDQGEMPMVELCTRFALSNKAISTVLTGPKTASQVEETIRYQAKGPLPTEILRELDVLANRLKHRPFEEPMILPFHRPEEYWGPGPANVGAGVKITPQ